jgi:hypothetical protein
LQTLRFVENMRGFLAHARFGTDFSVAYAASRLSKKPATRASALNASSTAAAVTSNSPRWRPSQRVEEKGAFDRPRVTPSNAPSEEEGQRILSAKLGALRSIMRKPYAGSNLMIVGAILTANLPGIA